VAEWESGRVGEWERGRGGERRSADQPGNEGWLAGRAKNDIGTTTPSSLLDYSRFDCLTTSGATCPATASEEADSSSRGGRAGWLRMVGVAVHVLGLRGRGPGRRGARGGVEVEGGRGREEGGGRRDEGAPPGMEAVRRREGVTRRPRLRAGDGVASAAAEMLAIANYWRFLCTYLAIPVHTVLVDVACTFWPRRMSEVRGVV